MAVFFLGLAALGFLGILCSLASAVGTVICVLLKYVLLPLGMIFFLCGIAQYGL